MELNKQWKEIVLIAWLFNTVTYFDTTGNRIGYYETKQFSTNQVYVNLEACEQ